MTDWREVRRFHLSVADADSVCSQVRAEHREAAEAIKAAYVGGLRDSARIADDCGSEPSWTVARNCILLRVHNVEAGEEP